VPVSENAEEIFYMHFPNGDLETVKCTERDVWMHWNRTYPDAVRLTDSSDSVMALRDEN